MSEREGSVLPGKILLDQLRQVPLEGILVRPPVEQAGFMKITPNMQRFIQKDEAGKRSVDIDRMLNEGDPSGEEFFELLSIAEHLYPEESPEEIKYLRFIRDDGTFDDIPHGQYEKAVRASQLDGEPFPYQGEFIRIFKMENVAYRLVALNGYGLGGVSYGVAEILDGQNAGKRISLTDNGIKTSLGKIVE